ncbi:nuclear transport factor 2 family protein [Leucobacter triazinivorans]|uniref:Nuclear transport factor 2 family protein n=1 Tax=Leucobacter triazinivorans TaxID=1784719 RepID=A0A4P6KD68_9MICO|nr:nuclear transport factor 2 family protein [Leucobacter triazinivorans]QBE48237.1 nuclear transport factor 2 family protein [Leucobacter triazinivorans]
MSGFTVDELLAVENAGWRALSESRGGTFYGPLMTAEAVFILVNGAVMTRDDVASSLDGAPGWDSYAIADARLIPVGDDGAALVYRAEATRADLPEPFVALMSSVYRRIDGRPRLALYQQTTITH